MVTVLVTGGAGFIGSHACVELLARGHDVVVVDNYANSSPAALARLQEVAGRDVRGAHRVDLRDRAALAGIFKRYDIDAVMHFAAMKAVGESMRIPLDYYDNNIGGTTSLLRAMGEHDVHRMVFSSSCSIYGDAETVPIAEDAPAQPANPYARSKWLCEQILADACLRRPDLRVIALRYFNPIGAHDSGLLGEAPRGVPHNVMPYLMRVASGRLDRLTVYGDDYPTPDGTAVRDYVHVMDVVEAHRLALDRIDGYAGMRAFNLGTGVGTSVLELARAVGAACGQAVPYAIAARRSGDVATLVADPGSIAREWGWRATRDLAAMCRDAWRFQQHHPDGYVAPAGPSRRATVA
ncbi:MAG: UDP-glucose 4-epimerase GalE, partial [Micromonosporaceae bacterium]|nr:UDP-glucose 4-epimerase GalE [Micromonosporaceae bacterium]